MNFFYPWLLLLIPLPILFSLLPGLSRLWQKSVLNIHKSQTSALLLPTFSRANSLSKTISQKGIWHRGLFIPTIIWSLLIISLAQPLWLDKHQPLPMTGRDLMLLVDVSGSMRKMDFIRDEQPISRLDMVKVVAAEFIANRVGDRTGLILFGNKPHLRAPLSHDRDTISTLIQASEIALAGESTAIGDAIGLGIKRMQELKSQSRVMIVLTDGANNEGMVGPRKAAELAALKGIKIYTIGIGGAKSPAPNPYGVWSSEGAEQYEKSVLQEVAKLTGGAFFHVLDAAGLQSAYQTLDQLEPAFTQDIYKYLGKPLYPWTLALTLFFTIMVVWLGWLPLHIQITKTDSNVLGKHNDG